MKIIAKFIFCGFLIFFFPNKIYTKNIWILDKELSEITFELPVFLSKKIKGQFTIFDSSIIIDPELKQNNRAIFSVQIDSVEINYNKYKELLFSNLFFDEKNYPIATLDSKLFTILDNSKPLIINAELQIKDIVHMVPINVKINHLANNWVQVKADLTFSRTAYQLGKESWSSTLLLRDNIHIKTNLFLIQE